MINDNQLSLNVFLITGDPFVKKISRQVQYSWSFGCQMLKSEGQWRNWSFGCLISKNGNNNADKYNILGLLNVKCWILENRRQKICVQLPICCEIENLILVQKNILFFYPKTQLKHLRKGLGRMDEYD